MTEDKPKHTPLPWIKRQLQGDGAFFIESPREQINKPYGQEILADDYFPEFDKEADCDFILEACNDYYQLTKDRDYYKELAEKSQEMIDVLNWHWNDEHEEWSRDQWLIEYNKINDQHESLKSKLSSHDQ